MTAGSGWLSKDSGYIDLFRAKERAGYGATGSVLQRIHRVMSALIERSLGELKVQGAELPPRDIFSLAAFIEEEQEAALSEPMRGPVAFMFRLSTQRWGWRGTESCCWRPWRTCSATGLNLLSPAQRSLWSRGNPKGVSISTWATTAAGYARATPNACSSLLASVAMIAAALGLACRLRGKMLRRARAR